MSAAPKAFDMALPAEASVVSSPGGKTMTPTVTQTSTLPVGDNVSLTLGKDGLIISGMCEIIKNFVCRILFSHVLTDI